MQGQLLLLSLALSFHRGKRLRLMNRDLKLAYVRAQMREKRGQMCRGFYSVHVCPVIKVQRDLCVPRAKFTVLSFDSVITGTG